MALHENRARLVDALDRTLPDDQSDELGRFLGALPALLRSPRGAAAHT
ncbi:MAG: hypothetical protein M5U28_54240 [Sandaracinaceae bacterium]|nr:hypothetical protein [Sandaracinaceae bacterium]